jgi:cell division protein FtsQ
MKRVPSFLIKKPRHYRSRWCERKPGGLQRCRMLLNRRKVMKWVSCLLALSIAVVAVNLCYNGLCRSIFFRINTINITDCQKVDRQEIMELSDVDIHTNLLSVDTAAVAKNIEAHSWIDRAEVVKNWPNELTIEVREKQAAAMINLKEGLYYLDRYGKPFAAVAPADEVDFPVINFTACSITDLDTASQAGIVGQATAFLHLAGSGNLILPCQNISEIEITAQGEMILYLLDHVFPIYLGKEDMRRTYSRLVNILKGLYKNREISNVNCIRMDYLPDKALLSMSESGARGARS